MMPEACPGHFFMENFMQLTLSRRVSQDTSALPDDVRHLKKALNRLGYYFPDEKFGITKIADVKMIEAIRNFQRDHGLPSSGIVIPGDATAEAINSALENPGRPRQQWHCVMDNKSCGPCIIFNGTIVENEEENTPGCVGACRCWTTPVEYAPDAITPVYPVENILLASQASRIIALWRAGIWLGDKVNARWVYGRFKSPQRWANQFTKRGWTEQQVTDTIRYGREYPAPNKVNQTNKATRYEYKSKFVVRDDKTKELLQVSDKVEFIPNEIAE